MKTEKTEQQKIEIEIEIEIESKIGVDTKLIAELEATYPKFDDSVGTYDKANKPWVMHELKLRDAHWRRRMNLERLKGSDEATMQACASVG